MNDQGLSVIKFTNKSSTSALFKASGEYLDPSDDIRNYRKLDDLQILRYEDGKKVYEDFKNWRQVLSSHYEPMVPILWQNRLYATQEHAICAMKFIENNPTFAKTFSLDSDSPYRLGKEVAWAKAAASESGKYKKMNWSRPKDIKPDELLTCEDRESYAEHFAQTVEGIIHSKYRRDDLSRLVLRLTRFAILIEGTNSSRGTTIVPNLQLMNVREDIRRSIEKSK